jgi:hypothetical protein
MAVGMSKAAQMFARNSSMAQKVAGGLVSASGRVGRRSKYWVKRWRIRSSFKDVSIST